MNKKSINDLTTGSIAAKLYRFALPIILINLLQAIYNLVDMIIVGRFTGAPGMVAVSQGGQITTVVFVIVNALCNAESALTGQFFGKKDEHGLNKTVHSMISLTLIIATVLMILIIAFSNQLLHIMHVPEEAFDSTKTYLIIYMLGTYFVYLYYDLYGLLRGMGESTAPMIFALISTAFNIILDYMLVGVFSFGAGGAALATILSQALSMILMIWFVKKKQTVFVFSLKNLAIDMRFLGPLLKVGLPQVIQFTLTNFSFILISALINSFGVHAAAAAGAANKINTFAVLAGQAVMAAMISFTAQNLPSKNYKRILKGWGWGALLAFGIATICLIICQLFPGQLLGLFTTETPVIEVGIPFLRIFVFSFMFESVMFCTFGLLTGSGHTEITLCCALASAFIVRYLFAWVLSTKTGLGFHGIAVAFVLAPIASLIICVGYTITGKWKKTRVKI